MKELQSIEPGLELDALVGWYVFGEGREMLPAGTASAQTEDGRIEVRGYQHPPYSTDARWAEKVFDRITAAGEEVLRRFFEVAPEEYQAQPVVPGGRMRSMGEGASPAAVCRAALFAMGYPNRNRQ